MDKVTKYLEAIQQFSEIRRRRESLAQHLEMARLGIATGEGWTSSFTPTSEVIARTMRRHDELMGLLKQLWAEIPEELKMGLREPPRAAIPWH